MVQNGTGVPWVWMFPFPVGLHVKICRRTWGVVTWESLLSLVPGLPLTSSPFHFFLSFSLPFYLRFFSPSLFHHEPSWLVLRCSCANRPSVSFLFFVSPFLCDDEMTVLFACLSLSQLLPFAHLFTHIMQYP